MLCFPLRSDVKTRIYIQHAGKLRRITAALHPNRQAPVAIAVEAAHLSIDIHTRTQALAHVFRRIDRRPAPVRLGNPPSLSSHHEIIHLTLNHKTIRTEIAGVKRIDTTFD